MHVGIKSLDPNAETGTGLDREYELASSLRKLSVDEIKDIRDKAIALEAYVRQATQRGSGDAEGGEYVGSQRVFGDRLEAAGFERACVYVDKGRPRTHYSP